MNEQIGGAIVTREIFRIGAVLQPRNIPDTGAQFLETIALRAIANNEEMKMGRPTLLQKIERLK